MTLIIVTLLAGAIFSCVEEPSLNATAPAAGSRQAQQSLWRGDGSSAVLALPRDFDVHDAELAAAIAEARVTASEARLRWSAMPRTQREQWAIKWAARTHAGSVEHVWVRPIHWSMFRIEGILACEPVNELDPPREHGDVVSFPAEELTDWVHFIDGEIAGRREGGFSLDVLERRFGRPGS